MDTTPSLQPTASGPASGSSTQIDPGRQTLLDSAVSFLRDPKVASSSLSQKITFLQTKGLSDLEVSQALSLAGSNVSSSSSDSPSAPSSSAQKRTYPSSDGPTDRFSPYGHQQAQMARPALPKRDWRDYFVMAVISGGLMYGLVALIKHYILPHLKPPPTSIFTQTSQAIQAQFESLTTSLQALVTSTEQLKAELEQDRDRVRGLVEEVERTLSQVRKREEEERSWREEVIGEVEGIKEELPKMLSSHTTLLQSNLTSLQTELSTLKPLLNSRSNPPTFSANPQGPQGIGRPMGYNIGGIGAGAGSAGGTQGIPSWQQQLSNGSSTGSPGIPSWQQASASEIPSWQKPAAVSSGTEDEAAKIKTEEVATKE
ncbi:Peroxisomal membrane anchor protein (peroxin) [Phaffia rhodozyma]|uniref:Peroxisomal membrane protein PEX14 n=1 Tax=Phaffia rhodozyma TaxID=264483 RepID=A0A0F7SRW2_PHARH|nr:Peroxisomal membrane anchor protein (peroxin) [Phaffia rhodozyma]